MRHRVVLDAIVWVDDEDLEKCPPLMKALGGKIELILQEGLIKLGTNVTVVVLDAKDITEAQEQ